MAVPDGMVEALNETDEAEHNVGFEALPNTCDELQTSLGFVTNDNIYGTGYDLFLGHVQPRPARPASS